MREKLLLMMVDFQEKFHCNTDFIVRRALSIKWLGAESVIPSQKAPIEVKQNVLEID